MPEINRKAAVASVIMGGMAYSMTLPFLTIKAITDLQVGNTALKNQTEICSASTGTYAGGISLSLVALLPTAGFCMINLYKIFTETQCRTELSYELTMLVLALTSSLQNAKITYASIQALLFNCSQATGIFENIILYLICATSWIAPALGNAKALLGSLTEWSNHCHTAIYFTLGKKNQISIEDSASFIAARKTRMELELALESHATRPLSTHNTISSETSTSPSEEKNDELKQNLLSSPLPIVPKKEDLILWGKDQVFLIASCLFAFELPCKSTDELASTFFTETFADVIGDTSTLSTLSTMIGKTAWTIASMNTGFLIHTYLINRHNLSCPPKSDFFASTLGGNIKFAIFILALISAFPYGSVPLLQHDISADRKVWDALGLLVSCFVFSAFTFLQACEKHYNKNDKIKEELVKDWITASTPMANC